jgi:hypothetical protein
LLVLILSTWMKENLSPEGRATAIKAVLGIALLLVVVYGAVQLIQSKSQEADISISMNNEATLQALAPSATATTNPLAILPAYLFATPGTPEPVETLPSFSIPEPSVTPAPPGEKGPDTSPIVKISIPELNLFATWLMCPSTAIPG